MNRLGLPQVVLLLATCCLFSLGSEDLNVGKPVSLRSVDILNVIFLEKHIFTIYIKDYISETRFKDIRKPFFWI